MGEKRVRKKRQAMDRDVEIEACTLSDAVRAFSSRIRRLEEGSIEIKAMREEQKGLFGMNGTKPAKIKISFKQKS